jgi:hypothetical protein
VPLIYCEGYENIKNVKYPDDIKYDVHGDFE